MNTHAQRTIGARSLFTLTVLSASIALSSHVQASNYDLNRINASYTMIDIEDVDEDAEGFSIDGKYLFSESFFIEAGYSDLELDVDLNNSITIANVGFGYISGDTSTFASTLAFGLGQADAEVCLNSSFCSDASEDYIYSEIGVFFNGDGGEVNLSIGYELNDDDSYFYGTGSYAYLINDDFGFRITGLVGEEETRIGAGITVRF